MAEQAVKLALKSVPYVTENYEKVWDPARNQAQKHYRKIIKKRRNRNGSWEDYSDVESYSEDDGPRTQRYSNGRRNGSRARGQRGGVVEERRAYRANDGRARSLGRQDRDYRRNRSPSSSSSSPPRRSRSKRRQSLGERAMAALGLEKRSKSRRRSYSSSPARSRDRSRRRRRSRSADLDDRPRARREAAGAAVAGAGAGALLASRGHDDDRTPARYKPSDYNNNSGGRDEANRGRGGELAVRDGNTNVSSANKSKRSSSSSSTSSSDVCSSSEDERRTRKMRGKEWLTAGLAAVATIHAAHGVYSSMEARDKRVLEVMKGEISPEESKKKRNKARLQDAAAIGIAALGIKGAYSEWQEVQESRHEMEELKKERQKRHEKRLRKAEKYGYASKGGRRNGSEPDLRRGGRYDDDDY